MLIAMIALSFMGYYNSEQIIQNRIDQEMELSLSTAVEKIENHLPKPQGGGGVGTGGTGQCECNGRGKLPKVYACNA